MTPSETLVRALAGSTRMDLRPFLLAITIAEDLMFHQGKSIDEICVTKDIYPVVGRLLNKRSEAVSRSIGRSAASCWDRSSKDLHLRILGRPFDLLDAPSDLIFYLAVYLHTGKPVFESAAHLF